MLKAVIMDFDGLIIDTEAVWFDIFRQWFRVHKDYTLSLEEFVLCVGSDSQTLFDYLQKEKDITVDGAQFAKDTWGQFIELSSLLPPRPGVVDFIDQVKAKGLKLALATSSKHPKAVNHLTRLKLLSFFEAIVTGDEVERVKPHPGLFLKALEKLGLPPQEALAVEDSHNGMLSAHRAGIRVLIIPNEVTRNSPFDNSYAVLSSLEEVNLEIIQRHWKKDYRR